MHPLVLKIIVTLRLGCAHCLYANFTTPEFDAKRKGWLDHSTEETILADFSHQLLNSGILVEHQKWDKKQKYVKILGKRFVAHAGPDNCWNMQIMESYLAKSIPKDEKTQRLLTQNMLTLWSLTTFFSQWPFVASLSDTSRPATLTYPAFIRSLSFLTGKHNSLFRGDGYEFDLGNWRTNSLMIEYIFRALTTIHLLGKDTAPDPPRPEENTKSAYHRDVLDMLYASQPLYNQHTMRKGVDFLTPVADRLSDSPPPGLSSLGISSSKVLVPLLDLLIVLFQHASTFDKHGCDSSIRVLDKAREELRNVEVVEFELFMKLLDTRDEPWSEEMREREPLAKMKEARERALYDGLALVFGTFVHPGLLSDGVLARYDHFEKIEKKDLEIQLLVS